MSSATTPAQRPTNRALRPTGKLLPEDARRHHRSLLLQQLFRYGPASRADLARSSGLTRVTVSDLVGRAGGRGPGRWRPRRRCRAGSASRRSLVSIAPGSRVIVAIDLSTDGLVSGALVDLAGTVLTRRELPLEQRRGDDAVDVVHQLVRELVAMPRRGRCWASASAARVSSTPAAP